MSDIANTLKMPKEPVSFVLQKHLSIRKLFLKEVHILLIVYQKQERADDSDRFLEPFPRDGTDFLSRYVWMHQ